MTDFDRAVVALERIASDHCYVAGGCKGGSNLPFADPTFWYAMGIGALVILIGAICIEMYDAYRTTQ